jgi:hypothetical protein
MNKSLIEYIQVKVRYVRPTSAFPHVVYASLQVVVVVAAAVTYASLQFLSFSKQVITGIFKARAVLTVINVNNN